MSASVNLSSLATPIPNKKSGDGLGLTQSFEVTLNKYAENMGLTKTQLNKIMNININSENLISSSNIGFTYEVFGMIKLIGFDQTFKFLEELVEKNLKGKIPSKAILDSLLFEKEETLYQNDIARIRDEFQVKVKGLYKCQKCGSQDTIDQTSSRQRSSDEATIFEISCQSCGHRWKRG